MRLTTTLLILTAVLCAGCQTGASTEVDPAKTRVFSKTDEKRPTETTMTKWSVTTAPQATPTYRLVVTKKEPPCEPKPSSSASLPQSSPSSPSPSPSSPSQPPTPKPD